MKVPVNSRNTGNCLATETSESKEAGDRWISFHCSTKNSQYKGWHFIELSSEHEFSVIEAEDAPVGYLIQYPRKSLRVEGKNPYSEYCIPPNYSPTPHRCAILDITPSPSPYNASELISPTTRPYRNPGLWISQPTPFKYPEFVEFHWRNAVNISRIDLFFDPSFGYSTPPFPTVSKSITPVRWLRNTKSISPMKRVKPGYSSKLRTTTLLIAFTFLRTALSKSMEIEILSTHGLEPCSNFPNCSL